MAKDDKKDEREDEDAGKEKPKSSFFAARKNLILIIVGVLGLVGMSIGGTMLATSVLSKDEPVKKVAKKKAPAAKSEEEKEGEEQEGEAREGEGEEAAEEEDDSVNPDGSKRVTAYYDFEQPFVVNFMDEGQLRYLQITVSVMFMDPKTMEELKRHMPLIRNNLVMLFSNQSRDIIITREGKEKIRTEAEAEVKKVLREKAGKPMVKSLYFTSFVMQ